MTREIINIEVEDLKKFIEFKNRVNTAELEDIRLFENGVPIDISQDEIDNWYRYGFSNIDFLTGKVYPEKAIGVVDIHVSKSE